MAAASQNLFNVTKKTAIDMKCARFAENTVSVSPPHSVKIIESKKTKNTNVYKQLYTVQLYIRDISWQNVFSKRQVRLLIMIFSTISYIRANETGLKTLDKNILKGDSIVELKKELP